MLTTCAADQSDRDADIRNMNEETDEISGDLIINLSHLTAHDCAVQCTRSVIKYKERDRRDRGPVKSLNHLSSPVVLMEIKVCYISFNARKIIKLYDDPY